jgi:hypothetical protein
VSRCIVYMYVLPAISLQYSFTQRPLPAHLYPFTDINSRLAPSPDKVVQKLIPLRVLRIMFHRGIQMFQLIIAELADRIDQFLDLTSLEEFGGVFAHIQQHTQLIVIMAADLGFHGLGARHSGLFAQQRGSQPQRVPGHIPQRPHRRRPHPVLRDKLVECLQVVLLLLPHVRDQWPQSCIALEYCVLSRVDQVRPEFARLVDA